MPSVVHAVPAAIALPDPEVPDVEGLETIELAAGEAAAGEAAGTDEAAAEASGAAADAAGCSLAKGATVAKTPPREAAAAEVCATAGAEVAAGAAEVAAGAAPLVAAAPATTAPHEAPVGAVRALLVARPSCSTESPGSGNRTSVESTVPHPLLTFATNMFGSALYAF